MPKYVCPKCGGTEWHIKTTSALFVTLERVLRVCRECETEMEPTDEN